MDTLSKSERSKRMSRIRDKNTKPELLVRSLVHSMGYRYRLHHRGLPGVPDLVFPSRRSVLFIHGCFWHQHEGCKISHIPKSRAAFWSAKLLQNRERDASVRQQLRALGWRVLVVWECETRNGTRLAPRLKRFLDAPI
jgi:DNA mismatch endonuclease (patch repair protein)